MLQLTAFSACMYSPELSPELLLLLPIIYENPKINKKQILSENKGKSGIYRWTNFLNDNSYIGSSVNLSRRLSCYYSKSQMENILKIGKSAIYSAILKHGLSKFQLEILEYCETSQLLKREDHFRNLLKPEYNIAQYASAPFLVCGAKKTFWAIKG